MNKNHPREGFSPGVRNGVPAAAFLPSALVARVIGARVAVAAVIVAAITVAGWPLLGQAAEHTYSGWWLPPNIGGEQSLILDRVFFIILWVTSLAAALYLGAMVYALIRYRGRPGRKAWYIRGNFRVEAAFVIGAALIWLGGEIFVMGEVSEGVWDNIKYGPPAGAMEVEVLAEQFAWNFRYPGPDRKFGGTDRENMDEDNPFGLLEDDPAGADDIVTIGELHVPVGRPVSVKLHSKDVIHSFFIPVLRLKWDALPREPQRVWFEATREGTYQTGCAELCGLGHTTMKSKLVVESAEQVAAWLETQKEE